MGKRVSVREKLGDFFIDIAKLVFGGMVLTVILDMNENKWIVLLSGIMATLLIAATGFWILKRR
jgi:hypothetical protein